MSRLPPPLALMPALFWAVDARRWIALAAFTALEVLAGQPETARAAFLAVGAYFLAGWPARGDALRAGMAGVAGVLCAAPQWLPLLQYLDMGAASRIRAEYNPLFYSAHTLLEFLTPEFFGTSSPAHRWGSNEGGLFVSKFWATATFAGAMLAAFAWEEFQQRRLRPSVLYCLLPTAFCLLLVLARWQFRDFISALQLEAFEARVLARFAAFLALSLLALHFRPSLAAVVLLMESYVYLGGYNMAAPVSADPGVGFSAPRPGARPHYV